MPRMSSFSATGVRQSRGVSPAGKRFVDEDFGCERTLLINELVDDVEKSAGPLFEELKFGFDL